MPVPLEDSTHVRGVTPLGRRVDSRRRIEDVRVALAERVGARRDTGHLTEAAGPMAGAYSEQTWRRRHALLRPPARAAAPRNALEPREAAEQLIRLLTLHLAHVTHAQAIGSE